MCCFLWILVILIASVEVLSCISSCPSELPQLLHFCNQSSYKRQMLPDWSQFLQDEIFADGCWSKKLQKFNTAKVKAYTVYLVLLLGWQFAEMAGLLLDRVALDLLQLAHGLSISTNYVGKGNSPTTDTMYTFLVCWHDLCSHRVEVHTYVHSYRPRTCTVL